MKPPDPAIESLRQAMITLGEAVLATAGDNARIAAALDRIERKLDAVTNENAGREGRS